MSSIAPEAMDFLESVIDSKIGKAVDKVKNDSYRATVVVTDEQDVTWIKVPGVGDDVPVDIRLVEVDDGDVVRAKFENGIAIIEGNETSPSFSEATVSEIAANSMKAMLGSSSSGIGGLIMSARGGELEAKLEDFLINEHLEHLDIDRAFIRDLRAGDITADNINAMTGYIRDLVSDNITANNLFENYIQANYADIAFANIDVAEIRQATVDALIARSAEIATLLAGDITAEDINAVTGYIKEFESGTITAGNVFADYIETNYAKADLANVENAWLTRGTIKNAAITDAMVHDVSANKLTAGTIDASHINVANLNAKNLVVDRINGQPVIGGYTMVSSSMAGSRVL